MKKFSLQKTAICLFIFAPLVFVSCLPDSGNQVVSQIQIGLRMDSIADTVTAGDDTMVFEEVRLIHGLSFFIRGSDSLLISRQAEEFLFNNNTVNPVALLPLTAFPEGTYQEFNFKIPKAPENAAGRINSIFYAEDGRRFTIVVEGTYNDSSFTYRSERTFEFPFRFNPDVSVPEFNESFIFLITTDPRGWFFRDGGQGFLDPRVAENSTAINDNIGESFQIRQVEEGESL